MRIANVSGFSKQAKLNILLDSIAPNSFRAHRPARALLKPEFFASVQSLQIDLLCLEEQRRIKCLYRIEWAGPEAAADYAERPDTFKDPFLWALMLQ